MLTNYTPHEISIVLPNGSTIRVPPSGRVARVSVHVTEAQVISHDGHDVPVVRSEYDRVAGLPDAVGEDEYIIVSRLVLDAARRERHPLEDRLVAPGELVRGPDGQPVGCRGLSR